MARVGGDICYLRETDGFWQAWVMNGKGKKNLQLTRSPVDKVRCTWTEAGSRVLVTTVSGEMLDVSVVPPAETELNLVDQPITDAAALPDAGGVLFSMPGAGIDTDDVWLVTGPGADPRRLTRQPYLEHFPVACPGSREILYLAGRGGNEHDIFRINLDRPPATAPEQLTRGSLYNFEPSCSTTGAVTFSSNRGGDGNYEIWKIDADGNNAVRLTDDPGADTHPSWSPDERFIVFQSTRDGQPSIYRVELKRSRVKRLTPPGVTARAPVWSEH